ncbi:putative trans-sialidase, Group V [Trypanosoma cruzi]|uniref:Putative trans-sialidase, Group V n=1 Tax=Trypanosoma cruzi TaxID=5693 RepID=A0A2V2XIT2_TRYCR|nr:putative trans-sialidase, Group V [Trypanosoma cruzi]
MTCLPLPRRSAKRRLVMSVLLALHLNFSRKKTADTPEELSSDALKKTQVLEEGAPGGQKKEVDVSRPTTAVKGDDIYMLVGQHSSKDCQNSGAGGCELLLVKGSVSGEGTNNKKIDWKVTENPPQRLFGAQLDSWTRLIGSGGSGVKMKDETLVFPVEGTKKQAEGTEEGVKTVSLIIQSKDNTDWTLSKGMSDGGCSDPSVVEWEEGKLMMMTACDGGRRRVYESGDKGESWTEALGTLSRVWGSNKKDGQAKAVGSGFITATVGDDGDNKKVMLVTLPVYADNDNEKGKLHLWLTDNTHIVDIGLVSGEDDAAASSLLYNSGKTDDNDEELIALYERQKKEGKPSPGMVSVFLTEQLKRVKEVLTTWKEVDGRVSQLCTSLIAEKERTSTGDVCNADKITAGLVGFLSGNLSGNIWRDEYLGVNATVNNKEGAAASTVASTKNGVKFTGRGAGAEWPVGKQGENQLYHFANYNFTLVATVSIDNVPQEGTIPLMGVRADKEGKNKLMELSYDGGKKWHVLCGDKTPKEPSSGWETETEYQVAIVLRNGTQGSVYVDGQRVGNGECALGNGASNEISHFYIGGDGENADNKEGVSVTVTNVLLYNRPWDDTEIGAFSPNKAPTPSLVDEPSQGGAIETFPGGGRPEEPRESMESSGVNGVSAPTVSSAKTSSGGEGSATQLVSEESSDGTQTVGGGFFSDGEPTVETSEGGTNGQKEEIHEQNGDVKAAALSSSLGNVSQGNNTDACSVCGSGLLPLLLLLGLWGFAAL